MVSRATEPIDGSASPRKPSVEIRSRSNSPSTPADSLEVAWRSTASGSSAGPSPWPSSLTRIRVSPPPSAWISMERAPASTAFSTSSFTALAGRSTTSPAAIRLTSSGGRRRMGMAKGKL
jgi:hypothetical protein